MTNALRQATKRVVQATLGKELGGRVTNRLGDRIRYAISAEGRRSRRALANFRDRYRGQRCFIVGNGPSLKDLDLEPLRNEITFGLNRANLMFDRLGFATTFLVSVNRLVLEQSGAEIVQAHGPKLVSWHCRDIVPPGEDVIFIRGVNGPLFSTDIRGEGYWEGATVTYVAMQAAYYFGFSEVVLIGVDHSFATKGAPHTVVTSTGADPNHFDPRYFGAGYRWQLPDLETSELAYGLAREAFERDGRRIVDATVGGKLEVFPKVDYTTIVRRPPA